MHLSNPDPCEKLTDLVIDNYRLLNVVGQGGMGCVYKAKDEKMGRIVALKVLRNNLGALSSREGQALGQLNHPNIVNVFYMGESKEGVFIAMEFVDGGTLHEHIGRSPGDILPIMKQSLLALAHAHEKGVIHRDIKPSNIMVSKARQVKVMDFGLAKVESRDQDRTITRLQAGTISYMSPEQVRGLQHVSHLSDIYSLGKTFYHILAGRLPFNSGESDQYSILKAIIERQFKPPSHYNAEVPRGLDRIIMKAIEKTPGQRYQSAREMYNAIEEFEAKLKPVVASSDAAKNSFRSPFHVSEKRLTIGLASVALILILTALTAWYTNREDPEHLPDRGQTVSTKIDDPGSNSPVPREGSQNDSTASNDEDAQSSSVSLTINTIPTNSKIQIGEDEFERIQGHSLPSGVYTITISADGYDTYSDTIQLQAAADTTLSIVLPPQGQLLVDSNISEALVFINGENRGRVPFDQALPQGNYSVEVTAEGFSPYRRQIRVQSRNNVRVSATFQPQRLIRIQVIPDGDLFIDGAQQPFSSESNWFETSLSQGTHTIRVVHNEYGVWEKDIQLSSTDQSVTVDFTRQVIANVGSNIWGAQIYIDGELTESETPDQITLGVGLRRIEIRKEGYIPSPVFIERLIEGNETDPIQFSFQLSESDP